MKKDFTKAEEAKIYTAKWLAQEAIEQDKRDHLISAIATLESALVDYDNRKFPLLMDEPTRPDITPEIIEDDKPVTLYKEPNIVRVKGTSWQSKGKFLTPSGKPMGLVVHYTVSNNTPQSALGVLKYFQRTPKELGYQLACPIMDVNGDIYIPENWKFLSDRNNHAGRSFWNGRSGLSSYYMGIEICNWGLLDSKTKKLVPIKDQRVIKKKTDHRDAGTYQKFSEKQEESLINLCIMLKKTCPDFSFDNVATHCEIAPARKSDAGGSLSMSGPEFRKTLKGL